MHTSNQHGAPAVGICEEQDAGEACDSSSSINVETQHSATCRVKIAQPSGGRWGLTRPVANIRHHSQFRGNTWAICTATEGTRTGFRSLLRVLLGALQEFPEPSGVGGGAQAAALRLCSGSSVALHLLLCRRFLCTPACIRSQMREVVEAPDCCSIVAALSASQTWLVNGSKARFKCQVLSRRTCTCGQLVRALVSSGGGISGTLHSFRCPLLCLVGRLPQTHAEPFQRTALLTDLNVDPEKVHADAVIQTAEAGHGSLSAHHSFLSRAIACCDLKSSSKSKHRTSMDIHRECLQFLHCFDLCSYLLFPTYNRRPCSQMDEAQCKSTPFQVLHLSSIR